VPDEVWRSFGTAGFTCWCPDPITVRPAPTGTASGPFPFPDAAAFVTADNPQGIVVAEEANRSRRAALAAELDRMDLTWHPAVGGDPDGQHHEPGAVVLELDVRSAAALGARFEQAAVYLWAPDALHLVACAGDRHDLLGYRATTGTTLGGPPTP